MKKIQNAIAVIIILVVNIITASAQTDSTKTAASAAAQWTQELTLPASQVALFSGSDGKNLLLQVRNGNEVLRNFTYPVPDGTAVEFSGNQPISGTYSIIDRIPLTGNLVFYVTRNSRGDYKYHLAAEQRVFNPNRNFAVELVGGYVGEGVGGASIRYRFNQRLSLGVTALIGKDTKQETLDLKVYSNVSQRNPFIFFGEIGIGLAQNKKNYSVTLGDEANSITLGDNPPVMCPVGKIGIGTKIQLFNRVSLSITAGYNYTMKAMDSSVDMPVKQTINGKIENITKNVPITSKAKGEFYALASFTWALYK